MWHPAGYNKKRTPFQAVIQSIPIIYATSPRQIEQTEYVDWIFELNSRFGTENLKRFSDLVNKETLWVVSEAGYTSYMVHGEGGGCSTSTSRFRSMITL